MNLLEQIRAEQIDARKNKDSVKASLLTTLLGEYEGAVKTGAFSKKGTPQDGGTVTAPLYSPETMQALIKKFIKNIDITLEVKQSADLEREKEILLSYLPKQLTEEQLSDIIGTMIENGVVDKNMGSIMQALNANFKGGFDGKTASEIIKKKIA